MLLIVALLFWVVIKNSGGEPTTLDLKRKKIPDGYDINLPLKIVIHGYSGAPESEYMVAITQEYLRHGGINLLVVDWKRLASTPCYPAASFNTWQVGRCTSEAAGVLPSKYVHAIGFSLGAHIAAYASNYMLLYSGRQFDRITGLDPALPLFATNKAALKLDPTDAHFVDVIHTNVGMLGKLEPTGHVDFYINGGTIQPMCATARNPPFCSHILATRIFAESVNSPTGFWGDRCPSYFQFAINRCTTNHRYKGLRTIMGEYVDIRNRGIYVVRTRNKGPPYALG